MESATLKKWLLLGGIGVFALVTGFFLYMDVAFPRTRCEAVKHLEAPDAASDCYVCHQKVTPEIAQDWYESKHGVLLVKCFVCHGQPDGKGAIPFAAKPDQKDICSRCHAPAMDRMTAKYGQDLNCNTCHPYHQNPMHGDAFENKAQSTKTTL